MKISFPSEDGRMTTLKEADFSIEDCPKNGGHCWVEFQSMLGTDVGGFPPKERTCKHCGLKEELHITPAIQEWKVK